jgi:glycosyltransferase involved in cell wall biosynthesis
LADVSAGRRRLLLFTLTRLEDMLAKGNLWYVRHYEAYFDEVHVVYLLGRPQPVLTQGGTSLVPLGTGRPLIDLFAAPWRLYRYARRIGPSAYLTADQVFSWWVAALVRIVLRARITLMPVCQPEVIYASTGKALSALPIAVERLFVSLSFRAADRVLTGRAFGGFVDWLKGKPRLASKLIVVDSLAEALPAPGFLDTMARVSRGEPPARPEIVYVGRLSPEKLVEDLVLMMAELKPDGLRLVVVGDGPSRAALERLARDEGVADAVVFTGTVPNEDLPPRLKRALAFVSTMTGTSLREAALCRTPIVAYDVDWVKGVFQHGHDALLVAPGDRRALAAEVRRLQKDPELRSRLAHNVGILADRLWSPAALRPSLAAAFPDAT